MLERLRLLPTVMLCAGLLLGLKVMHLAVGADEIGAISPARASEQKAEAGGEVTGKSATAEAQAQLDQQTKQLNQPKVSASEATVLESLSARHDELEKRARDLDMREQLVRAAEKKLEDRIAELKAVEARINQQISDNDKRNEERLAGVVKMYETMKPKEAARIFERLDMGVLIDVARRMEPRKMAAVLAAMDPVTAQDLTVELATGSELQDADGGKNGNAKNGAAPAAQPAAPAPAPQAVAPTIGQGVPGQPG